MVQLLVGLLFASYMYTDDSIHIGYPNTEAQAQLADTPLISVMAPLEEESSDDHVGSKHLSRCSRHRGSW